MIGKPQTEQPAEVLAPMDNLQEMATLPATILGKTDVPFYANAQMIIQKIIWEQNPLLWSWGVFLSRKTV